MKVAIMYDGSFFVKKYQKECNSNVLPSASKVSEISRKIMEDSLLACDFLFRTYFYDCPPYCGKATHPVDGSSIDFSLKPTFAQRSRYLNEIKLLPHTAVRSGALSLNGWKIPPQKIANVTKSIRNGQCISSGDIVPNIQQKQVDMKIGLDVAWLSSKRIVDKIVLFTGDSDFVPAMKFARKEGILVYISKFSYTLKDSLVEHSDGVITVGC